MCSNFLAHRIPGYLVLALRSRPVSRRCRLDRCRTGLFSNRVRNLVFQPGPISGGLPGACLERLSAAGPAARLRLQPGTGQAHIFASFLHGTNESSRSSRHINVIPVTLKMNLYELPQISQARKICYILRGLKGFKRLPPGPLNRSNPPLILVLPPRPPKQSGCKERCVHVATIALCQYYVVALGN